MCADVRAHRRHRRSSSLRKPLSRLLRACARVRKSDDKTEARAIAESRCLRSRASVKFNTKEKDEEEDDTQPATCSRCFGFVFGVVRGIRAARMLSYNIDSLETRSQVRFPTIVGRTERERERDRERERERGDM